MFIKCNYKYYIGRASKIYLIFLFLILPLTVFGFSSPDSSFFISNLMLEGEEDLNQCINHTLQFRWSYSHSVEHLLVEMVLAEKKVGGDSTIWESGIRAFDDATFRYVSFGDILDGKTYNFSVRAKDPKLGWSDWRQIEFGMNTPPSTPCFLLQNSHVFRDKEMHFSFSPSLDKQVGNADILYHIEIASDSEWSKLLLDTAFLAIDLPEDSGIFICRFDFVENREFFTKIRAYDGVEYSKWDETFKFFVNKVNEPPGRFSLKSPIMGEIIKGFPALFWNCSVDPDESLGGGLKEYSVYISTDSLFSKIYDTAHLSPKVCEYQTKNLENHCTYFWRVVALDVEGLESSSYQIGSFIVDLGNAPPKPPLLLSPKDKDIINPSDYLVWQLQDDPDKHDKVSCEISIFDEKESEVIITEFLSDSLFELARSNIIPGIWVSYDNRIKLRLNYFTDLDRLIDCSFYRFQVTVFDDWGGSISSNWENSIFQFDDNINQPPLPPDSGFEPDSAVVNTLYPQLKWLPGYDPDVLDRVRYQVILSRDRTFKGRTYIIQETVYSKTETKISSPLLENRQYFWKVRSLDLEDTNSEWSKVNTFWVNSINEAPDGPVELISPESLTELRPEDSFWWFRTTDPDPGDSLAYILELNEDNSFALPIISYRINSLTPMGVWQEKYPVPSNAVSVPLSIIPGNNQLEDNALYYWRVLAIDGGRLKSPPPDNPPRIAFNRENNPPLPVKGGFSPKSGEIVETLRPEIHWEEAKDPDFIDFSYNLAYQIELSQNSQFISGSMKIYKTEPGQNFIKIKELLEDNKRWFYRVRAFDGHGEFSEWSLVNTFITNAVKEPPLQVKEGFLPKDSMIVDTRKPLVSWLPTSDPDPGQTERDLYYIVQYFRSDDTKKVKQVKSKLGVTSIHLPLLKEDKYYVYQVAAVDPDGKKSDWSRQVVFGVNSMDKPPEPFLILSPYFNEDSVSTEASFIWKNTCDRDPGSNITYYLSFGPDSLFLINTKVVVLSSQEGDSVVYTPLQRFTYFTKYFWELVAVDDSGNERWASNTDNRPFIFTTIGSRKSKDETYGPSRFYLHQNYPNPFNAETRIRYDVAVYSPVEVTIYDILGKKIKVLTSGNHSPGVYDTYWNGTDMNGTSVPGGMYLCQMNARGFTSHKKVVLLR